jgi:hypothetical protein
LRLALVVVVSLLAVGCARYYWHRQGAVEADFQRESRACVSEAVIRYDIVSEDVYQACMRAADGRECTAGNHVPRATRAPFNVPPPERFAFAARRTRRTSRAEDPHDS